jgi:hypothetical protein
MKKFIFMLVVFLVGFGMVFARINPTQESSGVFAGTASPTTEYVIQEGIVTQSAVLDMVTPIVTANQSSFQAVMVNYNLNTVQPNSDFMNMLGVNTEQSWTLENRRRLLYLRL